MTNATLRGKPDAGSPHVRFDEGEVALAKPRRGSLLYKKLLYLALVGAMGAVLAEDAYIQSDGTQYIKTGFYATPQTKIICDFAYVSATPNQQRIFGAASDAATPQFSVASYINGGGNYAWACQDGKGNWQSMDVKVDTTRRKLILDSANSKVFLITGTTTNKSQTISTTRTNTSIWPLALFANNNSSDYSSLNCYGKVKLYACDIYDGGKLVRCYRPYKSEDGTVTGLKELLTGAIHTSPAGNAFTSGGDITANPAFETDDYRITDGVLEYHVQIASDTGGSVAATLNGTVVEGGDFWIKQGDLVEITATPASGYRFLQWLGTGEFAADHYAGDAHTVIAPTQPACLTANWTAPKTRTWHPTTANSSGSYLWSTAENWLDESGATGIPLIGDTVLFGATSTGPYSISSDGSTANPLYEVRFENNKTTGFNQGSLALLAGGLGLQYLRNAGSTGNWSGIYLIGDGIVPVNIANNVTFAMQKSFYVKSKTGYRTTATLVKQGPGTFVCCNQSGNYGFSVPKTVIQEGVFDLTLANVITGCAFGFEGTAAKTLQFGYASYTADLQLKNGGLFEREGTLNHQISANGKIAQVIFTGTPLYNPMVFSGSFTKGAGLQWAPDGADCTFVCSNAVSDTIGKLTVSKGTVKLVSGATFTSLSELNVAAGAVLNVEAGSGVGFTATNLVVGGKTARLELAAGVQLACTSATLAGAALPPGTYGKGEGCRTADWITGEGTVTVAEGPENAATWSGEDTASTALTQADNWAEGAAPDLTGGTLLAPFATGGTEAHADGTAAFSGLVLQNGFGGTSFAFTAGEQAGVTLNANGLNVLQPASETTWTMGWPLTVGVAQTWTVAMNSVFELTAPVSGSAALTLANAGTVRLNATSTHSGPLEITGAGTVEMRADNALGTADRTVSFHHMTTKYVLGGDVALDSPLYSGDLCESLASFMTIEPNAHVTFNGRFNYKAQGGITFGAGSVTVFKGGVSFDTDGMKGMLAPYGSGTIIVTNGNISACRSWRGQSGHPVTLELGCAANRLNDESYWAQFPGGTLKTTVTNAIRSDAFVYMNDATFDLCGCDQQLGLLATTAKTRITSARPAVLTVNSHSSAANTQDGSYGGETRVNLAVFSGQVSLKKPGSHPHTLGAASSTTGSVEVTAGTLTFNADAQWPNATAVKVTGGSLVLQNAAATGTNAVWSVTTGTDPVVTLNYTGMLPCAKLRVNGVKVLGGTYGAVGSGADYEVAWITGTGFLQPKVRSTCLIVR